MQALTDYIHDKTHVIWDWNGTLLADIDHAVRTVNRLLREEDLPAIDVDSYRKFFGFPVIEYYQKLGFDTSPQNFQKLCERFNDYFHAGLASCQLWPGVVESLAAVKLAGKTQSLLSASEHSLLHESIRLFKVDGYFDHVFGIFDKAAASKVERGRELIRHADTPLAQTVLIGDTDHDLEVGDALGIDVILVEHGHQCPLRLREVHHTVVRVLE